ncbi:hypothetical protein K450DRAFT_233975 [Umbelopsis ramanniana AG]|uniref:Uncharacterized protein n=1 Tax=Umbelopsis ramanniana AG TaxID=1314678 RepID=A0AAD5HE65_UMBRA|nr:uncharacterized protein K450DRAFT_233975 [Umbelopsis ramanniana AG]KAI8580967.1 hypothetical protein K450DRAFT_233975 [Umbelopsis ramanniana AG]
MLNIQAPISFEGRFTNGLSYLVHSSAAGFCLLLGFLDFSVISYNYPLDSVHYMWSPCFGNPSLLLYANFQGNSIYWHQYGPYC